jgi:murein hydrolase activator
VILLLCTVPCGVATAGKSTGHSSPVDTELRKKSSALDSIRIELEKGRTRLRELQKEEGSRVAQLEQVEKNISASRTYLKKLADRIASAQSVIGRLQDSLDIARAELENRQKLMARRIRTAYTAGAIAPVEYLLAARNPIEILHRARYLNELGRYDRTLAQRIETSRKKIDEKKKEHETERAEFETLVAVKKEEQKSLLQEESARKEVLEKVRKEKNAHGAMIAELEAAQKELNRIIKTLESRRRKVKKEIERKAAVGFEKRKGKLPWPVDGNVVAKYGKVVHPVYKTVIMNTGIDIAAEKGSTVQCVAPGTVIHVGAMRGLGKLVIVDHAAGYITVYANMGQIDVAQENKVEYGSVLGRAGTKLHFEIRRSEDTLDPVDWLEKPATARD